MALKLTVLTAQREALGPQSSIVFGVAGGSIGRASDNDWVLPDPEHWLSAHHARVRFRDGVYLLLDTSTNGVYVNDAATPIGRRGSYVLRHGDILRFGSYQVEVTIDIEAASIDAPEASSISPLVVTQPVLPADRTRPDIGASLQLQDLLSVASAGDGLSLTEDTGIRAFDNGQRAGPPAVAASPQRQTRMADRAVEQLGAIEAFCRGAGADPKDMAADAPARILHLAGVLLREALVGLKALALLQREAREKLRINAGKEDLQRIALTGLPVEDLLLRLLLGHDRHELDAVLWVRETLGSARRHDVATMTALSSAFWEFVARLEPNALDQGGEAVAARFRSLIEATPGSLPHLFVESFAQAFVAAYLAPGSDSVKI